MIGFRQFYQSGAGNNVGDVLDVVNEDWTADEWIAYVEKEESGTYVLDHNEASRPDYYMADALPNWEDGGWYDYDKCDSKDKDGATCDTGCHCCPYEMSCHRLQREQQVEWIEKNAIRL